MNYKKTLEQIVQRRKEQLARSAESYAAALRSDAQLYAIEIELRRLNLEEIHGKYVNSEEIKALEQKKSDRLLALGITKKLLNPPPLCNKCGDTGLVGGKFCDCVKRQAIADDENINLPLNTFVGSDKTIEKQNGLDALYEIMRSFVKKFPDTNAKNIVLLGSAGTGKTFLSSCIAGEIAAKGHSVVYLTAFGLLRRMLDYHTSFDADKNSHLLPLIDCDLLIIDDLGTESILKNVTLEYLYIIINERTIKGKHLIITTNLGMDDLGLRYGNKIVSRLFDKKLSFSKVLDGTDLRKQR